MLNPPDALVAMHDKLETALRLRAVNLPHPRTAFLPAGASPSGIELPVVIKPRFGSWGRHVHLCTTKRSLRRCLQELRGERLVSGAGRNRAGAGRAVGRDLRVLVAAGEVVGAIARVAADGEWRTNVALGGTRHPVMPGRRARSLALAAAAAVGADLVGVDLLPHGRSYVVLELNGAVDFTADYALQGGDVFAQALSALGAGRSPRPPRALPNRHQTLTAPRPIRPAPVRTIDTSPATKGFSAHAHPRIHPGPPYTCRRRLRRGPTAAPRHGTRPRRALRADSGRRLEHGRPVHDGGRGAFRATTPMSRSPSASPAPAAGSSASAR